MTRNEKICRVCLCTNPDNTFVSLTDTKLQMLKFVSPLHAAMVDLEHILCWKCLDSLQSSFDFKSRCLAKENYLKTLPFDSRVVLTKVVRKDVENNSVIKREGESVCRLCFQFFDSDFFTNLSQVDDDVFLKDMFDICLPEVDLTRTVNPLMCNHCLKSLRKQYNMLTTLLDTNDRIDYYGSSKNIGSSSKINLFDVLEFSLTKIVKEEPQWEEFSDNIEQSEVHLKTENELLIKEENEQSELDPTLPIDHCFGQREPAEVDVKLEYEKRFNCISCRFVTNSETHLDRHLKLHGTLQKNAQGMFECDQCDFSTTRQATLRLHVRKHEDFRQFQCDQCDFVSKWATSLHQHMWTHEKDRKMFACPACPYKTLYRKHLRRHSKLHGTDKEMLKYHCQHCDFATDHRTSFVSHNSSKHGTKVALETFACEQCEFTTDRKCVLTKHRKAEHKLIVCEYCSYRTATKSHLKGHMLKHKDEKDVTVFRCANCDFRSKYKNSLRLHLSKRVCWTLRTAKDKV